MQWTGESPLIKIRKCNGCLQKKNCSYFVFSRQLKNCRPHPHPLSQKTQKWAIFFLEITKKSLIFGVFETIPFLPPSPPPPVSKRQYMSDFYFASIPNICIILLKILNRYSFFLECSCIAKSRDFGFMLHGHGFSSKLNYLHYSFLLKL